MVNNHQRPTINKQRDITISIQLPNISSTHLGLIDCGATDNFIDKAFVERRHIPTQLKDKPEPLAMFDGRPSVAGHITREVKLSLSLDCGFGEQSVLFKVTQLGSHPIVLGLPWLTANRPVFNWDTLTIHPSQPSVLASPATTPQDKAPQVSILSPEDFFQESKDNLICLLRSSILPGSESEELATLSQMIPVAYHNFLDVFSKANADQLPPHRPYDHRIPLQPGITPPFGPIYSLSEAEQKALKDYLEDNLAKGFIAPSESPAASPILFVKKKDGSLRLCVDYRRLNNITIKNRYPLPLISDLLDRLRHARYFTKIDLRGAYNLLRIAEGDEWKTAFRTRYGLFEYKVMPFGLTNAPASFQHLMNHNFRDMLDVFAIIYLDDILIYSKTLEEHEEQVKKVLQRLREINLFAKGEKCEFHREEVEFLGFIINHDGIVMDPKKVQTVLDWPTPKKVKDVQAFLGFANFYRRFIRDFAKQSAPLTRLTRKDTSFVWSEECQLAFDSLKAAFTSADLLRYFDPAKPIIIETDASDFAIAAILSQPSEDTLHPVAFYSRKMDPAELNYEIHDKEMLAIVAAFKEWRHYLEGAQHTITVMTDHRSLEYFTTSKKLNQRQARWSLFLTAFDFKITYRPGKQGAKPDALTRRPDYRSSPDLPDIDHHNYLPLLKPGQLLMGTIGTTTITTNLNDQIIAAYPHDPYTAKLLTELAESPAPNGSTITLDSKGLLYHHQAIIIPDAEDLRLQLVKECHDSPAAGHPGQQKTYDLVSRNYWWPKMKDFVHQYVNSCDTCQRTKVPRHKPYGQLKSLPVPPFPFSSISMDFIEQLPTSNNYTAILVVVDRLTKLAIFIPTTNEVTAEGLASLYLHHVWRHHGLPESIISDRGSEFNSRFWKSLTRLLDINQIFSTAYHPQTDGQTERVNQTLEQYLRSYTNYQQSNWSDLLPLAEFAYNNSVHSSTGITPFFANKGYHPCANLGPASITTNSPPAEAYVAKLNELHQVLREEIEYAKFHQVPPNSVTFHVDSPEITGTFRHLPPYSGNFHHLWQPSARFHHFPSHSIRFHHVLSPSSRFCHTPATTSNIQQHPAVPGTFHPALKLTGVSPFQGGDAVMTQS